MTLKTLTAYHCSQQQERRLHLKDAGMLPALQSIVRVATRVRGDAVQCAWMRLTASCPVLAVRIGQVTGQNGPLQIVGEDAAKFHEEPQILDDTSAIETQLRRLAAREGVAMQAENTRIRLALAHDSAGNDWLVTTVSPECCDARSLQLLTQQLLDASASGDARLREEIDYFQYSEWQHTVRSEGEAADISMYWQTQFNPGASPLSFMPRRPLSQIASMPAIGPRAALPNAIVTQLRELSKYLSASAAQVVLAAVANLLSRLNGTDTFSVGWLFDGRATPGLENTIGPLDQVLPIRLHVAPDDTVWGLVDRVRESMDDASDHTDFIDWNDLYSRLSNQESILPFTMEWLTPVVGEGVDVELVDLLGGEAAYEVKLTIVERETEIEVRWSYMPDRVDSVFVEHLATQWLAMLSEFVTDALTPCSDLRLYREAERLSLVETYAGHPLTVPGEKLILDLIDEQVCCRPDAIALSGEEGCLTYAALDRRVRRLASLMRSHVTDGLVGIDATFRPDAIVLMVASMAAGLTYVPIDPEQTADRLAALAKRKVLVVFGTAPGPPQYSSRIRYILLDETSDLDPCEMTAKTAAIAPSSPAYVILTSGSTGTPKGVTISHESLARSTFGRIAYYPDLVERFLLLSPMHFDSSCAGIYWTLACGGELLLPSDTTRRDATRISELLPSLQVSHLLCIPTLYGLVLDAVPADQPCLLRTAIVAGESCPRELVSRHQAVLPETALYNEYGPSEGTVWASVLACNGFPFARISIGRPAPHVSLYVLDGRGETTAVGQAGELYIGGAIASGYWQNARETGSCFVPDSVSGSAGRVLYRSGDYAAWNADRSLAFAGRRDDQVKILGFRVELAEVCEAIVSHAAVRHACVRFLPERGELAAYVVPRDLAASDLRAALKLQLRTSLPRFMHPHHWVLLPELPTLPGGKIDMQRLPAPEFASTAASLPAAGDALESLVAAIWQHCLHGHAVARNESFFAAGGNSLNGIQVTSRLQEALQTGAVTIQMLFEFPVLSDFTRALHRTLAHGTSVEMAEDPLDGEVDILAPQGPASFFQERMYFLHMLDPGGSAYNCPFALRLEGKLDPADIEECLRRLQQEHAALRTRLCMRGGLLHQEAVAADINLQCMDLSDRSTSDIDALILEEGGRPFDLEGGPLLRATLFRLDNNVSFLVVVVHHAVFDGWSLRILVSDFKRLYQERRATGLNPAGTPAIRSSVFTYAAYSRWQRRQWERGLWRDQLHYWSRQLSDAAGVLALPTDRPRREGQPFGGETLHFEWPASMANAISRHCQEQNITLFMFLEALLALVLYRYSGQTDVLIGTPVANRLSQSTEELIGPLANTLVVRNRFQTAQTWNELLLQVRSTVIQAYCNQDVPFEKVVEGLRPVRTLAVSPLFQVMLVLQNVPVEPFELEGLQCEVLPHRSRSAKFDFMLTLFDPTPVMMGQLEYNTSLFNRQTMEYLLRNLRQTLESVLEAPNASVDVLDVISGPEKRILQSSSSAPNHEEAPAHLIDLFEAQVARRPDAVAVNMHESVLTYAALDRQGNRLANYLLSRGAKPDQPVAIMAQRSLELVVSLLAILKAGCAYLPLDCDAPAARLERIWNRAGRPLVVVDAPSTRYLFWRETEVSWSTDAPAIRGAAIELPTLQRDPEQLAYVIFTSGSTGEPKGVMVPHRGIVNRLQWMQQELGLLPHEAVLQKTPYTFDVSLWELFWPLLQGARLTLAPPGEHTDIPALRRLLREEQISYTHFVPSMLGVFMRHRGFESLHAMCVVCSGESLDPTLCERFFAQTQGCRLYNMYGPTEASVDVSSWPCNADDGSVPIGRPIRGAELHIASAAHAAVPLGGIGELVIGGIGLARGYLADARTTARAFLPDNRGGSPGARLYRSGDLARYRHDGALEFLGRSDSQIKLRGIRIELGEIEYALRTFSGVTDAASVVRAIGTADARIVAYVAGIPAGAREALKGHVGKVLPSYMVPADILVLEEMPRLANGKVDRAALPVPATAELRPHFTYVAAGDTETRLAELWTRHLRLDAIDPDASFFEAGGHSLAAISLLTDLNHEFGINMKLLTLLESRSFIDLAARINEVCHLRALRSNWSASSAPGEVERVL